MPNLGSRFKRIAVSLCILLGSISASAADKWAVGVNTMFILEYAMALGAPCSGCPGNAKAHSLQEIEQSIHDLVANQHVGAFREIVPLSLISPNGVNNTTGAPVPADTTNYAVMDAVLNIFKSHNVHLVLAVGNPVPSWAAPWSPGYECFIPPIGETANFESLKHNISWAVGNYLNHLNQNGFGPWMAGGPPGPGGLFVEGFNEWNTTTTPTPGVPPNSSPPMCSDKSASTPERAARLQGGIQWVANYYGVPARMAAPSVVFPPQGPGTWYSAYYAAGGVGAPNLHIYGWGAQTVDDAISYFLNQQLTPLIAGLPQAYKSQVIIGETGFAEQSPLCPDNPITNPSRQSSLNNSHLPWYNAKAAELVTGGNSAATSAVQLMTVWRLDRLDGADCESRFGIAESGLKPYLPAGINMFQYLGGTGISPP